MNLSALHRRLIQDVLEWQQLVHCHRAVPQIATIAGILCNVDRMSDAEIKAMRTAKPTSRQNGPDGRGARWQGWQGWQGWQATRGASRKSGLPQALAR